MFSGILGAWRAFGFRPPLRMPLPAGPNVLMTGFPGDCKRQKAREQPEAHLSRRHLRRFLRVLHPVSPVPAFRGNLALTVGTMSSPSSAGKMVRPMSRPGTSSMRFPRRKPPLLPSRCQGTGVTKRPVPKSPGSERTLSAPSQPFFVSLFP